MVPFSARALKPISKREASSWLRSLTYHNLLGAWTRRELQHLRAPSCLDVEQTQLPSLLWRLLMCVWSRNAESIVKRRQRSYHKDTPPLTAAELGVCWRVFSFRWRFIILFSSYPGITPYFLTFFMAKFLAELLGCTLPDKGTSPMFEVRLNQVCHKLPFCCCCCSYRPMWSRKSVGYCLNESWNLYRWTIVRWSNLTVSHITGFSMATGEKSLFINMIDSYAVAVHTIIHNPSWRHDVQLYIALYIDLIVQTVSL